MVDKCVAMIAVRSRPHVLNRDSARASVLRVIIRGKNLKFADYVRGLREVIHRASQTLRSRRVEQSDAIEDGDPGLRLAAVDVRPGNIAAAPHHAGENGSEVGGRTHGPSNQQRNVLDDLRINTAAKLRVFIVQRGSV